MKSVSKWQFKKYKRCILDLFCSCQQKCNISNQDIIELNDYLLELQRLLFPEDEGEWYE